MCPGNDISPPEVGPEADDLAFLLQVAVSRIQDHETDPGGFLDWMREYAPQIAPAVFPFATDHDKSIAAYWLGVGLWNETPLADNRYRPRPLPAPQRNQPCPCGSGRKFKHCCRDAVQSLDLPMPAELIWTLVLENRSDAHWLREAAEDRLPVDAKVALAFHFYEKDKMRPLIKLLEPELLEPRAKLDPRLAPAVDLLCDAYDETYRTDRKKAKLLRGLSKHPVRAFRAEANQRLAAWLEDQGDLDGAWQALQDAIRADPDHPGAAVLEITLLCARGEKERAGQRADFWYRRLLPLAEEIPEAMAFLDRARSEPCAVYREFGQEIIDRDLSRLIDWIGRVRPRELPNYAWVAIDVDAADEAMQGARELEAPESVAETETGWEEVMPLDKPFSIQWLPLETEFAWGPPHDWLDWLERHPEAADSLDIIDDLVSLILSHPDADLPWVHDKGVEPLLDRALEILRQSQKGAPDEATLPWLIETNRPALRLLARAIAFSEDEAGGSESLSLMRWYLRLNPGDNHGWRAPLVNALLRAGDDAEALAVIERYPDDLHPEIVYGRVLALYRSGAKGRALTALAEARDRLPEVLDFLVRDKVRRPAMRDDGLLTIGGRDQAWLYREEMRDTWLGTDGAMEMLRGLRVKQP